jgi:hypothetical protein
MNVDVFPERTKFMSDIPAICRCLPASGCGEHCINRIMSYLCGKECPCADRCSNRSLARRRNPAMKVFYVGPVGSGW